MSDSDDEYGPLAATWGSQTPVANDSSDNVDAWKTLIDPDAEVGPNDLGSGNLHRRGHNYKPIGEELILAQRLKIQVPKKKMQEAIRKTESDLSLPKGSNKGHKKKNTANSNKTNARSTTRTITTTTASMSSRSSPVMNKNNSSTKNVYIHSSRSTSSNGNSISNTQKSSIASNNESKWSNSDLVEVPFWETSESSTTNHNSTDKFENHVNNITKNKRTDKVTTTSKNEKDDCESRFKAFESTKEPRTTSMSSNGWISSKNDWNKNNSKKKNTTSKGDPFDFDCWDGFDKNETTQNGWDTGELMPWGSEDTSTSNEFVSRHSYKNNILPSQSDKHQNSIPKHYNHHYQEENNKSRFSIRSKQRYSDVATIDVPEPVNYRHDGRSPIPSEIAPPPPPENRHLITINVELSDTVKIPVQIKELDDPQKLATEFGKKNDINAPKIIEALTKLFASQKEMELKKRQRKLQKRVLPKPTPNPFNSYHNNVYNDPSFFSQYASSPAYQSPTTSTNTTTNTSTFANSIPATTRQFYSRKKKKKEDGEI
ncbi:MAG: hypothetical protein EXX96DRAFT_571535 [Benjaminiella poitrasii]|nr:MAG: hypothetical protein EXX96DRAFT_571535 [Benjaminiella poitrasii]